MVYWKKYWKIPRNRCAEMKKRALFHVNQPLEVFDPGQGLYYRSAVQEIAADHIVIAMPMRQRQQLHLARDSIWDFRLALRGSLCYFRSRCLGQRREGELILFLIAWPREVKRVQRRRHFRSPCSFDAHYWVLAKPGEVPLERPAEQLGEPETAVIVDISGGGLQFVASAQLPIGAALLMALYLESRDTKEILYVKGKIIWLGLNRQEGVPRYRHALEYAGIPESLREKIVGFIFTLTREQLT